mmetsp:Transcript_19511/g.30973  ORF Transcript_19511/g.30973 Transcript_19511/m.30973 type:complete len:362 (+) Transcript_19511:53-1138(+)
MNLNFTYFSNDGSHHRQPKQVLQPHEFQRFLAEDWAGIPSRSLSDQQILAPEEFESFLNNESNSPLQKAISSESINENCFGLSLASKEMNFDANFFDRIDQELNIGKQGSRTMSFNSTPKESGLLIDSPPLKAKIQVEPLNFDQILQLPSDFPDLLLMDEVLNDKTEKGRDNAEAAISGEERNIESHEQRFKSRSVEISPHVSGDLPLSTTINESSFLSGELTGELPKGGDGECLFGHSADTGGGMPRINIKPQDMVLTSIWNDKIESKTISDDTATVTQSIKPKPKKRKRGRRKKKEPEPDEWGYKGKVKPYTPEERAEVVRRYREKRARRNFGKLVRYRCRRNFAVNRPRVGGRFTKLK